MSSPKLPYFDNRITGGVNGTSLKNCKKCKWMWGCGNLYEGCSYYLETGKHRPHEETGGENCEVFEPRKGRRHKCAWTDLPTL